MEDSLKESLNRIHSHKENFGKQQLMSLECTTQFQNGMHLPLGMGGEQQAQSISWLPNNDSQHLMLTEDQSLLHQRDLECSTDASVPGYSDVLATGGKQRLMDRDGMAAPCTT
ncbi:hypothetical protein IFM89_020161 [Coptis chinensis]|uniref:Uncharacterized protein n=1 Tax=Coptis chinensis TaxID=261450 RepID=A0A835H7F8_9MAGN|nr:hypothetical protein IFM89_020161 [Coptis chinensis]